VNALTVDVLVQQRTAHVERPLTYLVPDAMHVAVGDVVQVPLGSKELYGFVVGVRENGAERTGLRPLAARSSVPRAFDEPALALAEWIAERYCCSLAEALAPFVHAAAIPRVVDRFVPAGPIEAGRFPSVPARLVRLIGSDFADGFALDAFLRHPEARRSGDRRALLRALGALTAGRVLERRRELVAPRIGEATEHVLTATGLPARGPRVEALVTRIAADGPMRRRDALLAGFSQPVIARAIRTGALAESEGRAPSVRGWGPVEAQDFIPTPEQAAAIARIETAVAQHSFDEILLQGVTGSGKTFVYIRAIARVLALGGRAIVLVPEIALTPQTARRFEGAFGERVAVLHSGLSERERFDSWHAAARGEIDVIVGARSALFAPLENVRLIVVDEAHERTYKQDSVPRYHAVDVARERMRLAGGTLLLGSATPPLEAYAAALAGRVAHLHLRERAGAQPLPETHVVDMAQEFERGNKRIFATRLVDALGARLERREKSVLLINRRGSANFILCRSCGAVPNCQRCSVSMTVHRAENLLRCHQCDAQAPIPLRCPACGEGPIREFGVGTQKVAEMVQALFPAARVVRMDSDTTTRVGAHARLLDEFAERADVLVGTQMIAKGLDFPTVTLVGVVAADIGLHVPDFRASERTFDLLTQVAGRSGRKIPGEAIVQTYSPKHPAIAFAACHDYDGFAEQELETRRDLGYPPFGELIYLAVFGRRRERALEAAQRYAELLRGRGDAEVLGPAPFAIARANDEWRFRIALKTADGTELRRYLRTELAPLARAERAIRFALNVDP
jgi:primosomal protein N' (replication factor Y)